MNAGYQTGESWALPSNKRSPGLLAHLTRRDLEKLWHGDKLFDISIDRREEITKLRHP